MRSKRIQHDLTLPGQLRDTAEAELAKAPATELEISAEKLLHELQVHQIELEMQNEALQQSQLLLETSRDRYLNLYEFAPVGYLTLNREALISEINLTACVLLGTDRKKLINHRFAKFVAPHDGDRWHRWQNLTLDMAHYARGEKATFELELISADGACIHTQLDCLWRQTAQEPPTMHLALVDISALKRAEAALRIAAVAFESQEGVMITDAKGNILRVNQAFTRITGYSAEEVIGQNPRLLSSGRESPDFYKTMWQHISRTGGWDGEIWNRRKNGEIYPEHLTITAVTGPNGAVSNYVGTLTDITMSREAANEIAHLAYYDQLTRLPNRRLLMDRLKQAMASSTRSGQRGALIFIDLDNFKTLNDSLGHDIGDLLLQQVAERLNACVREEDTVARLGGDEFVVMLEGLSKLALEAAGQVRTTANKILVRLNQPYQLAAHLHHSTPSIGATLFNDLQGIEELMKQADIAMYQAKKSGRNAIRFFDPIMQENINTRARLEKDLHLALAEKQFSPYYQLQITHSKQIIGAELLIRWRHPERGLVSPDDFIPLAEDTGLILPIGLWVLETACAQIKQWEQDALTQHLQLAVNISARQFHQDNFVEQVCETIRRNTIRPDRLKLELTESTMLDDIRSTIAKMHELKAIGVKFSMDDFGTGYSSLSYLTQLPLDQLKIDRSFIHNIGIKPSDAAIVQTIISMADNLNIEIIAEGVETEEQRTFLKRHGCALFQGYLFSKPVPLDEFEQLLRCSASQIGKLTLDSAHHGSAA